MQFCFKQLLKDIPIAKWFTMYLSLNKVQFLYSDYPLTQMNCDSKF